MAVRQYENSFGGTTFELTHPDDLPDLPENAAELVTNDERAVLTSHADYFLDLASSCNMSSLKQWLTHLAGQSVCRIEINLSQYSTAIVARVGRFQLSLRRPVHVPPPGLHLAELYSMILATWHEGFPNAGGLHEPRTIGYYGLNLPPDSDIPDDAVAFFTTACGDSVIACNRFAYWYSHDSFTLHDAGTVDEFLSSYFYRLLEGAERNVELPE